MHLRVHVVALLALALLFTSCDGSKPKIAYKTAASSGFVVTPHSYGTQYQPAPPKQHTVHYPAVHLPYRRHPYRCCAYTANYLGSFWKRYCQYRYGCGHPYRYRSLHYWHASSDSFDSFAEYDGDGSFSSAELNGSYSASLDQVQASCDDSAAEDFVAYQLAPEAKSTVHLVADHAGHVRMADNEMHAAQGLMMREDGFVLQATDSRDVDGYSLEIDKESIGHPVGDDLIQVVTHAGVKVSGPDQESQCMVVYSTLYERQP